MMRTPVDDALRAELEALNTIATALSAIPDPAARARILGWVNNRFAPGVESKPQPAAAEQKASDPTLAVESLEEMFEADEPAAAAATAGRQPVESLIKGFVSDFNQLVVEWQGA